MDTYIEVQLDESEFEKRAAVLRQWFEVSLSRIASSVWVPGASWFASLTKEDGGVSDHFSGDIAVRKNEFLTGLASVPYYAALEVSIREVQIARIVAAPAMDGGVHLNLSVAICSGEERQADFDYCLRMVQFLEDVMVGFDPVFGRIECRQFSDRTNLEIALRRRILDSLQRGRDVLRGYAWVTICPKELVRRLGGADVLVATGSFFRVVMLPSGAALLQATETMDGFSDEAMEGVFNSLAPVLPPGMPRRHPAHPRVRFVVQDASAVAP